MPILLNGNLSLNQTLLTYLLYVRQTWSLNFSVRDYLPLIRKHYFTHMHGLAVYVKFWSNTGLISRKLFGLLIMFSTDFTSLSVLLLIPLSITFFVVMHDF